MGFPGEHKSIDELVQPLHEHRHSGLGYFTPSMVHHGRTSALLESRQQVMAAAYAAHPERLVNKAPQPPGPTAEVWINRPQGKESETQQMIASLAQ